MPLHLPSLDLTETAGRIRERIADQSQRPFLADWATDASVPANPSASMPPSKLEDRLLAQDAQIEAVQENFRRLGDSLRADFRSHQFLTRSEIQKLATQIREIASQQAAQNSTAQLELRIGNWLSEWQNSVHHHLLEREKYYIAHFNHQLSWLWHSMESRLAEVERRQNPEPVSPNPPYSNADDPFPIAP